MLHALEHELNAQSGKYIFEGEVELLKICISELTTQINSGNPQWLPHRKRKSNQQSPMNFE